MLTSNDIINLATRIADPGSAGRLEAARRRLQPYGLSGASAGPQSHIQLIRELQEAAQTRPAIEKYSHPEHDQQAFTDASRQAGTARLNGGKPAAHELAASDIAWLNRLPSDPAAVSYDDAVQLAGIAKASSAFTNRSDARLVQSIWQPVKEVHDTRAAEAALRNAQSKPSFQETPGLREALADAIAAEVPNLTPEEAWQRAQRMIDDARSHADHESRDALAAAKSALNGVGTARAARLSAVKV